MTHRMTRREMLRGVQMKVKDLKGARNIYRIECSCGDVWIRYGNKALDNRERQKFIEKHAEHNLKGLSATSTVTR